MAKAAAKMDQGRDINDDKTIDIEEAIKEAVAKKRRGRPKLLRSDAEIQAAKDRAREAAAERQRRRRALLEKERDGHAKKTSLEITRDRHAENAPSKIERDCHAGSLDAGNLEEVAALRRRVVDLEAEVAGLRAAVPKGRRLLDPAAIEIGLEEALKAGPTWAVLRSAAQIAATALGIVVHCNPAPVDAAGERSELATRAQDGNLAAERVAALLAEIGSGQHAPCAWDVSKQMWRDQASKALHDMTADQIADLVDAAVAQLEAVGYDSRTSAMIRAKGLRSRLQTRPVADAWLIAHDIYNELRIETAAILWA